VDLLVADCSRAKNELGWEAKTSFDELVIMMVDSDLERHLGGSASGGRPAN
jgi:GDPmannose 4,6-dehydratase